MKRMSVGLGGREQNKIKRKKKKKRDDNFKIRVKTRREGRRRKNDDKNMVQIHDEQRSIQMTILHRDIYIYTKTLLIQAL